MGHIKKTTYEQTIKLTNKQYMYVYNKECKLHTPKSKQNIVVRSVNRTRDHWHRSPIRYLYATVSTEYFSCGETV